MTDRLFLGSEVIIIPVDDVRRLVNAFLKSRSSFEHLQRLGVLGVLNSLENAVRRHDYRRWERAAGVEPEDA